MEGLLQVPSIAWNSKLLFTNNTGNISTVTVKYRPTTFSQRLHIWELPNKGYQYILLSMAIVKQNKTVRAAYVKTFNVSLSMATVKLNKTVIGLNLHNSSGFNTDCSKVNLISLIIILSFKVWHWVSSTANSQESLYWIYINIKPYFLSEYSFLSIQLYDHQYFPLPTHSCPLLVHSDFTHFPCEKR